MAEPSEGTDPAAPPEAAGPVKLPRWRRILVSVLVVLVCVLVPVSVLGVWVRNTVLHTDQYVDTMAPLASDPAVQKAIATRVTNTLVEETNLEDRITDGTADEGEEAGAGHPRGRGAGRARRDPEDRAVRPVRDALERAATDGRTSAWLPCSGQGQRHHHHEERRDHRAPSARSSTK